MRRRELLISPRSNPLPCKPFFTSLLNYNGAELMYIRGHAKDVDGETFASFLEAHQVGVARLAHALWRRTRSVAP